MFIPFAFLKRYYLISLFISAIWNLFPISEIAFFYYFLNIIILVIYSTIFIPVVYFPLAFCLYVKDGLSQGKTLKDILSGMNNNGNDYLPHVNHQNPHSGSQHTFGSIHSSGYSNSYQPSSSFSDPSGWTRDPSYSQIPGHSLYRRND